MAENGRWVTVPLETAQRHPLYGVGGWLTLIAIGMVVSPIRAVVSLGPMYSGIDFGALHPTLATFIAAEIVGNGVIILWSVLNAYWLFAKHRLFPRSLALMLGFSAIFVVGDLFVTKAVVDSVGGLMTWEQIFDPDAMREVARSLISASIWIPYAFVSRRINVTYLARVRGDDPLLRENSPEGSQST